MPKPNHLTHVHTHPLSSKKVTNFDKLIFIASFVYPLSALPQAIEVFHGKTDGVSVVSWVMFFICGVLFLIYGWRHKVPPMIISNSIWVVADALVITGLLLANTA